MRPSPVADAFRQQRGLITRTQAHAYGLSNRQIDYRLKTGEWTSVHRGVYRNHANEETWESRLLAACLATGGLASHRSAAKLWGLDGYRSPDPEITVPRGEATRLDRITAHESTQFDLREPITIDGIPATGVGRTILDLGAVVGVKKLGWTVDDAIRRELVEWPDLYRVLVRHSRMGRNGCGTLRALLDERYGEQRIPDSKWNRMVAELLVDAGLPMPELEYEIHDDDGFVGRLDLAYPTHMVTIELDSMRWHHNADSFVKDRRKRNRLIELGYLPLTFTWADYADAPKRLCETVRTTLRGRSVNA